jgi:hypothetical protein
MEMEQMTEHPLAKIAVIQDKVVSHHKKMNACQERPIAKMDARTAEMRAW